MRALPSLAGVLRALAVLPRLGDLATTVFRLRDRADDHGRSITHMDDRVAALEAADRRLMGRLSDRVAALEAERGRLLEALRAAALVRVGGASPMVCGCVAPSPSAWMRRPNSRALGTDGPFGSCAACRMLHGSLRAYVAIQAVTLDDVAVALEALDDEDAEASGGAS